MVRFDFQYVPPVLVWIFAALVAVVVIGVLVALVRFRG